MKCPGEIGPCHPSPLLLWVYFASQLFFFGAEFSKATSVYYRHQTPPCQIR